MIWKYGAQMSASELAQWFANRTRYEQLAHSDNTELQLDYDEEEQQNDGAGLQRYQEPKP